MPRNTVVDNRRPDVYTDVKKFANGKPYKRVKLRLHKSLVNKFISSIPKGFIVTLHPPNKGVHPHEVYATFQVNEVNPDPRYIAYKGDIDSYLANLGRIHPSIAVLNDKVTDKEVGVDKPPQHFVDTILGHPGLEGEKDKLRSKAKDVIEVDMTETQVKDMEAFYQREKKNFIRTRLNDGFIEEAGEDSRTHEKMYKAKLGRI